MRLRLIFFQFSKKLNTTLNFKSNINNSIQHIKYLNKYTVSAKHATYLETSAGCYIRSILSAHSVSTTTNRWRYLCTSRRGHWRNVSSVQCSNHTMVPSLYSRGYFSIRSDRFSWFLSRHITMPRFSFMSVDKELYDIEKWIYKMTTWQFQIRFFSIFLRSEITITFRDGSALITTM